MGAKEEVRIELEKKGVVTRVTVTTLQRQGNPQVWVKNLEVTAKNVQIHSDKKLKVLPSMGEDHRHDI